jgi:hypothetical protein
VRFFNSRRNRSFALLQVRGYSTGQISIIQLSCEEALHEKNTHGSLKPGEQKLFPGAIVAARASAKISTGGPKDALSMGITCALHRAAVERQ